MGPVTGFIYSSILAASPAFMKAAISDKEEEYKNYLKEGIRMF